MKANSVVLISLMLLSMTALIAVLTFSALNGIPNNGLFNNSVGNVSDKYETEIVPASYAFSIWGLIFFWQVAWMIYAVSSMCRTNKRGLVFLNPVVLPIEVHAFWIASCIFTFTWYFTWDRELLMLSFFDLLATTICGHIAVARLSMAVLKYESMLTIESKADLICIRVLIQNGMDLFFSWTTVATLLGFSMCFTYDPNFPPMSSQASSTLCLGILGVLVISWSVLENTVFFKLFRYVYAWYFVIIWALIAIIVKNPDVGNTNCILAIVLLCVAVLCLVAKIVVFVRTPTNTNMTQRINPCCK